MTLARLTFDSHDEAQQTRRKPLRRDSYPVKKRLNNINKVIKRLQLKQKLELTTSKSRTGLGSDQYQIESKRLSNMTTTDY